ncbi:DNA recombination protein RmuC [Dokdonella ginsengisoli]|uniref:DNA recombination protein RmuC n=1 Tax=Dokdonella ginsengisoli TaxID=363846 RepID=A0ABV9QWC0_9GAMM
MPDLPLPVLLGLAALAGFVVGLLLLYLASRRWVARAHEAGRSSRDTDVAVLAGQREAAAARADELAERLQRYERDWSAAEQNLRKLTAHAAAQQSQAEQLGHQLADARRSRDDAQGRLVELTRTHAALEAGAKEQAQAAADKLQLLEQAEQRLRESFRNLAGQILDDKAERFREQSSQQLGGLLDPLKLQLKEFRETIHATHASEQRERGMLAQEIQTLKQLNQRISEDAINLTRALKGDTRSQGAWGELVLERVLEASGLQAGREYETQASYADGDGGRQRPDVIVHLPEDKDIVVDAKVSLVAYERFVAAVDEGERAAALGEHVASLRRHIDGLSSRNYSGIEGLRTLDFVLLFVPVEAAFIEAVRADDRLYTQALAKNISLVSPSTLLATLRTVAHLWRIERRNVNAMEIAKRAANLHDNFAMLVDELQALGGQLDKAQRAHASALRRLTEGGKGSVLLQVQSLAEMGAPVKKALPPGLLSAAGTAPEDDSSSTPSG